MLAATMHGYNQPFVLQDIKTAEISPDQVLVKVGKPECAIRMYNPLGATSAKALTRELHQEQASKGEQR